MSIAFVSAQSNTSLGASPASVAFSVSGSNTLLFVGILTFGNNSDLVTSITYNGVTMTRLATNAPDASRREYVYYLVNPTTGSNNIVVTYTGSPGVHIITQQYSGVSQTGFPDANSSLTNSGTSIAGTVTIVTNNSWIYAYGSSDQTVSAGANTTFRVTPQFGAIAGMDSNGPKGTGSQSVNMTVTPSGNNAIITCSFAPAPTTAIKTIDGLAVASVKTVNGLAIASVKTFNGLA